jgi:Skp family chaperone for outer membrane proteins
VEKVKVPNANEEIEKELKQIKSQITKVETEIGRLETEIKKMDDLLADSTQYQAIINDKAKLISYDQMKVALEKEMKNWEALQAKWEETNNKKL